MDDFVGLDNVLCTCDVEAAPKTGRDRLMDALKLLVMGTLMTTLAALAAIGLLSVYFSVLMYS